MLHFRVWCNPGPKSCCISQPSKPVPDPKAQLCTACQNLISDTVRNIAILVSENCLAEALMQHQSAASRAWCWSKMHVLCQMMENLCLWRPCLRHGYLRRIAIIHDANCCGAQSPSDKGRAGRSAAPSLTGSEGSMPVNNVNSRCDWGQQTSCILDCQQRMPLCAPTYCLISGSGIMSFTLHESFFRPCKHTKVCVDVMGNASAQVWILCLVPELHTIAIIRQPVLPDSWSARHCCRSYTLLCGYHNAERELHFFLIHSFLLWIRGG